MRRLALASLVLLAGCGGCSLCPQESDQAYYERVCITAGMKLLPGTRTCLGPDSSFINLKPRKR